MDTKNYGPDVLRRLTEEAPTTRELLQMALDALHQANKGVSQEHVTLITEEAIAAIRSHLAKPEPVPVAWVGHNADGTSYLSWRNITNRDKKTPLFTKDQL